MHGTLHDFGRVWHALAQARSLLIKPGGWVYRRPTVRGLTPPSAPPTGPDDLQTEGDAHPYKGDMTPERMKIATPCSENLDAMQKTERGFFCDKCQHDVVDLRRTPKKKALAVLNDLRLTSSGKVCVRVMARADRTPVFLPDPPSMFARFAAPIALASSLAACAPSSRSESTPVIARVEVTSGTETPSTDNVNGRPPVPVIPVATGGQQNPPIDTVVFDHGMEDMAGGLAWGGP